MYKNLHLYLIDDDREDLDILQYQIKAHDETIQITCYDNPEEAFSALKHMDVQSLPDLLVIDNNMPKLTGVELIAKLRANEALQHTPIVMYSTDIRAIDPQMRDALRFKALNKSLTIDGLKRDVTEILNHTGYTPDAR